MNFGKIASKFWRNLKEIEKTILNDSGKIMETLLGKTEVIRNLYRWYKVEILKSFSEVISVKLVNNYEEILEKRWKNKGNISHKL